jgi:erythritol kinase
MVKDLLIGIDAGTSMLKAVAFDFKGRQLAVASMPNLYVNVGGGGVEQDMARTWRDTAATLRQLAGMVDDLASRTAAVGVTGQGDGTWLIDEAGEPAGPAWLWLDGRAAGIVAGLREDGTGARTYALTGSGLNTCQQGAQLVWMSRHRPEILARAVTGCHCKDWLYFKLTGQRATDVSEASFTFGDFRERCYAPEIPELLGIPELERLLPPIVDGVRESHELTAEAAAETGLLAGTPVVLGYVDVICTGIGGGLYDPVRTVGCSVIGSTGMHMRLSHGAEEVELNAQHTGYTMPFPVPGAYAQMQSNMAATLNIDWLVDRAVEILGTFAEPRSRQELLPLIDARVADRQPGAVLFHPFIYEAGERGPFVEPLARAQFLGLTTRTSFFDLVRGVYEGLSFAARDCYAAMGHRPDEVRITGGAARSATLRRIFASVLGVPIRRSSREEAGAAGVAMMAAVRLGLYPDMAACCREWVDPLLGELEPPDPALVRRYDALFPVYRAGYETMFGVWRDLDHARREDTDHA